MRQVKDFAVSLAFFLAAAVRFLTEKDRWDLMVAEFYTRQRCGIEGPGVWPWLKQVPDDIVRGIPPVMAKFICGRPWLARPSDFWSEDVHREARPCLPKSVVDHCASLLNVGVGVPGDDRGVKPLPPSPRPSVPKQPPRTGKDRARDSRRRRDERLSDGAEARDLLELLSLQFFCLAVALVAILLEPQPCTPSPAAKCSPRRLRELADIEDTYRGRAGCRGPGFARILFDLFGADDLPRPVGMEADTLGEVAQRFIGRVMGASAERKLHWFRRATVLYDYPVERGVQLRDLPRVQQIAMMEGWFK